MISFASATGNMMNRLGKVGALGKNLRSYQNTQLASMTDTATGVVAQLNSESDIQAIMGSSYIGILTATSSNFSGVMQSMATQIFNREVFRDNPRLNQTLTQTSTLASIFEVIRQMKAQGATVLAMTITITTGTFQGVGNGTIVASNKRPLDGLILENAFSENLQFVCAADSYIGGTTVNNETMQITGTGPESDVFAFDWPLGSGASFTLNVIDGNTNQGSGNILNNSGFQSFTVSNVPDNWTLVVGTAGVNIFQEQTITYSGTSALKIVGDGVTLTEIKQQFNNSSGNTSTLQPLTQYAFNIYARRDGIAASQGVWEVSLVDSNNNVINDQNGTPNVFDIDLTALTVNYAPYNVAFRTPEIMPSQYFIRMRHPSVAKTLQSGRAVYFDTGGMGAMTQAYVHGPFVACFAGSIPFVQGDYANVTVANSRGAAGVLDTWQTLLYRLLPDVQNNEILFPSNASAPTISDGLIA